MGTMERISLQEWANRNVPDEQLFSRGGYWKQIVFVRDNILRLLAPSYEEYTDICDNRTWVISTHMSKSVLLPVYRIELPNGMAFTMRYNFYNWKVSVSSPRDIHTDFMGLFDPNGKYAYCYCEGFPEEYVYGSYAENKRQFTIELYDEYKLYNFFWIFSHCVLGNRNKTGSGRYPPSRQK